MQSVSRRPGLHHLLPAVLVCLLCESASAQQGHSSPAPKPAPPAAPTPAPLYVPPDPAATVNGQTISKADLEHFTEMYMNASGHSLKNYPLADQKKAYRTMLDNLIVDRLVSAQAVNEVVSGPDLQKRYDEVRRQYPDDAAFRREVARSGQTEKQVEQNIHNEIAREQWLDNQIKDQTVVTPEEVEKFYKDGPPTKFDEPDKVTASHIMLTVRRDAPPEVSLAVEKRAGELVERIKKGEDFDALVLQYSEDPTVKQNKGKVGSFSHEGVMPEFADAAFKLKVGEVSAPVRTQFGYHIIKVTDRKPAHTDTFEEAKDRIRTYIQDQKRQKATAQTVQKLRDNAKIEVAADLRNDPPLPPPPAPPAVVPVAPPTVVPVARPAASPAVSPAR